MLPTRTRAAFAARRHTIAFTLVELLVVIGIIALLIAILLPALAGARDAANRVKCLATLREMAHAAYLHSQEHRGYMPVAGPQGPLHLGVNATPQGLRDEQRRKYMYYRDGNDQWRPLPLPAALGHYMGLGPLLDSEEPVFGLERALATEAVRSRFACPSQDPDAVRPGNTLNDQNGGFMPRAYMSYVFNGEFLARRVHTWGVETPAGQISRVRRPTEVFLFADGLCHDGSWGYAVVAGDPGQRTLYERCFGGGRDHFDYRRHGRRINVVFVDGHGATLWLPDPNKPIGPQYENRGTLDQAGLLKGIFD